MKQNTQAARKFPLLIDLGGRFADGRSLADLGKMMGLPNPWQIGVEIDGNEVVFVNWLGEHVRLKFKE